jgi:hypothetical protein
LTDLYQVVQDEDGVQPLSAKQARLLKKLARQPDALAGLLQASTKKSAAKAKVRAGRGTVHTWAMAFSCNWADKRSALIHAS